VNDPGSSDSLLCETTRLNADQGKTSPLLENGFQMTRDV
jgi:hypothetical protein